MVDSEMPLSLTGQFGFPAGLENKVYCLECDEEAIIENSMDRMAEFTDWDENEYSTRYVRCVHCGKKDHIVSRHSKKGTAVFREP